MVSKQEGQQGDQESPPSAAGGHQVGEQRGKAQSQKKQSPTKQRRRWRPKLPAKWREPISVLTLVLCILTGLYVYFTGKLLEETSEAVELTRRSVEATEEALRLAKEGGEEARKQAEADRELTRRSVEATEAALRLTEESNRHTAESVAVSQESLRLSRAATTASIRPWLALETLGTPTFNAEYRFTQVRVSLVNGGSTPALNVAGRVYLLMTPEPVFESEALKEFQSGRSYSWDTSAVIIAPHSRHTLTLNAPPTPPPSTADPRRHHYYVVGEFTYEDFQGLSYDLPSFCFYEDILAGWVRCLPDRAPDRPQQ